MQIIVCHLTKTVFQLLVFIRNKAPAYLPILIAPNIAGIGPIPKPMPLLGAALNNLHYYALFLNQFEEFESSYI